MRWTWVMDTQVLQTNLGAKAWMAVTGLTMAAWCALHMAGNLLVLTGRETFNGYAAALQGSPLLWGMRAALLSLICVHVARAARLWSRGRKAGGRYRAPVGPRMGTLPSRSAFCS